jgi:aldehyde dehydrogenase (NAD+)
MSQTILPVSPSVELMNGIFDALQQQSSKQRMSSARDRIRRLDALYKEIWCRRDDLKSAMWEDFRKPGQEVDLTEIFVVK